MENTKNLLFGVNSIAEKLRVSPGEVTEIIMVRGAQRPVLLALEAEARRLGLPVSYLHSRAMDHLVRGQQHQGVLAKVEAYSYFTLAELRQDISSNPGSEWILILDGLTDPRNFGALLRSAEAVGVRHVVIPKDRAVGVTATAIKASAGAAHYLKICQVANLTNAISNLKDLGFWIAGLDVHAKDGFQDRDYPAKIGVVVGSEGGGIRPLIRKQCDFLVSIPMRGEIASLNVAVAGAVFLYELLRQRMSVEKGSKAVSGEPR